MSESCNHNCESCSENCSQRTAQSFLEPLHPQSSVKKVIGVVSGKGGVGKSLVTSLTACGLRARATGWGFWTRISQGRRSPRHSACMGQCM